VTPAPEVIAAAQAAQLRWKIPASVTIAQYGLESGWGAHTPPGSNNPFGIKAAAGQGGVDALTAEFVHARWVTEDQPFAKFCSLAAAFDAHARLLATSPCYAPARARLPGATAFAEALTGVYATDPGYGGKLCELIRRDGLTRYDAPPA
jgi:flagellum-specific peptidoglycan hydrolase FlgJ